MGKATRNIGKHNWGGRKTKKSKYMTRNEAVKYLQLSLGDFRRLCILKGIHPKQPTKAQLSNKSKLTVGKPLKKGVLYYYVKDIKFMNHDPLIVKFREHKIFLRRLSKANSKLDTAHAQALESHAKPHFTYDHLVKERYPTFSSALYDLDDCLTLMFMFHHLPSGYGGIEPQRLSLVKKLCDEFCSHVVTHGLLRKCFVSFKGIYYQAQLYGQRVTWIVPHGFTQQIPQEADFKVFKTFLTFYTTLLTFVNFKLYHDVEQEYPPVCPSWKHSLSSYLLDTNSLLNSMSSKNSIDTTTTDNDDCAVQQELNELIAKSQHAYSSDGKSSNNNNSDNQSMDDNDDDDEVEDLLRDETHAENASKTVEQMFEHKYRNLYRNMTFYIGRECPVASLEFVIRCFGGKVVTDATLLAAQQANPKQFKPITITHYVIDRPTVPSDEQIKNICGLANDQASTIEFIQPQWIYDCVNARVLIPVEKYTPGHKLPPHLSPFEQDLYQQQSSSSSSSTDAAPTHVYEPKYAQELRQMLEQEMEALRRIKKRQGASRYAIMEEETQGLVGTLALGLPRVVNNGDNDNGDDNDEIVSDDEDVEDLVVQDGENDDDDDDNDLDDEEAEEREEERYARELEMEKTGVKYSDFSKQLEREERDRQIQSIRATGTALKSRQQLKEEQELELRKSMMSRRKAKLYEQEMKKLNKQKRRVNELMKKRLELEEKERRELEENGGGGEGTTVVKTVQMADSDSDDDEAQEVKSEGKQTQKFDMDKDENEAYDLSQFEPIDDSDDDDDDDNLLSSVPLSDDDNGSSDDEEEEPPVVVTPSKKKGTNNNNKKQAAAAPVTTTDSKKRKEAPKSSNKDNNNNKKNNKSNKKQRTK